MKTNRDLIFNKVLVRIIFLSLLPSSILLLLFIYLTKQKNIIEEKLLSKNYDGIAESLEWLGILSAVLVIVLLLVIIFISVWFFKKFKKSLEVPLSQLNRMAVGDIKEESVETNDEAGALIRAANQIIRNQQRASYFTQRIGEGKFDEDFKPVSEQDMLGNSLVQMRDKLRAIAEEDNRRNWVNKGLALFGDLLRRSTDYKTLTDNIIAELVKYTKANQGGFFVVQSDDEKEPYLELGSCYAYNRKKYIDKRVRVGEGLIGQCFLERQTIFLKEIPQGYLSITSGLGEASPKYLLIVPLMVNDVVEAIAELGSFLPFEQHEIEFVERVGEQVASVLSTVKINERTRNLFEQSQQQAEEMRAQEEEMRQNMEELQATQEHLQRQTEEMKKIQESLELEKSMFHVLLEYLPDRITYKDTQSRILRINKAKADRLNMRPEEVVGKTDYDFFPPEHAEKAMKEEQEIIRLGKPLLDIEEKTILTGDMIWSSTSRIPFKNERNQVTGMFVITRDIKDLRVAELTLRDQQKMMNVVFENFPLIRFKISSEGRLFDVQKGNLDGLLSDLSLEGLHVSKFSEKLLDAFQGRKEGIIHDQLEYNNTLSSCAHYILPDSVNGDVFVGMTLLNNWS